jgi:hypothetical protein
VCFERNVGFFNNASSNTSCLFFEGIYCGVEDLIIHVLKSWRTSVLNPKSVPRSVTGSGTYCYLCSVAVCTVDSGNRDTERMESGPRDSIFKGRLDTTNGRVSPIVVLPVYCVRCSLDEQSIRFFAYLNSNLCKSRATT